MINKIIHSCLQMWNFFSRVQLDTNSMQFIFSCSIPYSFTSLTHEIASWTLEEKFPIKVHLCIAWQKIPIVFEICDSLGKELQKEEFDKVENECHCNLSFFKLTKPCSIWQPKTTTKKLSRVLLSFVGWCSFARFFFQRMKTESFSFPFKSLVVWH